MPEQMLIRTRAMDARAAEILRLLHRCRRNTGLAMLTNTFVYDELVTRRAINVPLEYHEVKVQETIMRRPSASGVTAISHSLQLLEAMALVTRTRSPNNVLIHKITDAGRREAELWFPELVTKQVDSQVMVARESAG